MDQLQALRNTILLAEAHGMPGRPGDPTGLDHLRGMEVVASTGDFPPDKLGRWLGWAQCAVVAADIGVTLADMKALNKNGMPINNTAFRILTIMKEHRPKRAVTLPDTHTEYEECQAGCKYETGGSYAHIAKTIATELDTPANRFTVGTASEVQKVARESRYTPEDAWWDYKTGH